MDPRPMDIDPIDGGPKDVKPPPSLTAAASSNNNSTTNLMQVSEEEEARQAIEMLRGDDVSARVAAANRLEAVASVLGEQRTRDVRCCYCCGCRRCCSLNVSKTFFHYYFFIDVGTVTLFDGWC
jgi:hypothetical protein